jgi:hypothetical protein
MKKALSAIILVVGLLLTARCAVTDITSFRDPAFSGRIYHKLLIFAPFKDIESRIKMENAFKNWRPQSIHTAKRIPSIEIIVPTRSYTDEDIDEILLENSIDGVLLLIMTDAYSTQSYVPPTSSTQGFATFSGNVANYYQTTKQYGGYYVSKPRIKFEIYLYDVSLKKVAWMSSSLTSGNAFARFGTLANSLAGTTMKRLIKDGLLQQ